MLYVLLQMMKMAILICQMPKDLQILLRKVYPWVNIDKIYFDAFNQVTTPTGQFYPDVTQAINDRINSGTLIFNYIGHGNETSLAHERVITPEILNSGKTKQSFPFLLPQPVNSAGLMILK